MELKWTERQSQKIRYPKPHFEDEVLGLHGIEPRYRKFDLGRDFPSFRESFDPEASYYLSGKPGAGKTAMLSAMLRERTQSRFDRKTGLFITTNNLLHELKKSFNKKPRYQDEDDDPELIDEKADIGEWVMKVDVLALDDLGAERITDWTLGELNRIINNRYNRMMVTYIASNFDIDGLAVNFDQRMASRIRQMCVPVWVGNKDRRLG